MPPSDEVQLSEPVPSEWGEQADSLSALVLGAWGPGSLYRGVGMATNGQIGVVMAAARTIAAGLESWRIANALHCQELGQSILETSLAVGLLAVVVGASPGSTDRETVHTLEQLSGMASGLTEALGKIVAQAKPPRPADGQELKNDAGKGKK